ncbi:hypothetical protein HCU01_09070 [Halomonas cupida]|uniref:Uncharacterized SAM-binding protein YcdF, DUF218 family n=1 Tax=Halomonas cupida TaxID=44933 RepID=A0A1M7DVZ4_9GAMM|nr:YdcF family protein [Halomonas cupida]GEN22958.1 hypothetical protein HCU01_09070 [Halomonas cupida]SHL83553.1 Uncharacterized SAM-binding protein YcdF, DUF218 family [Halomonas cupida]
MTPTMRHALCLWEFLGTGSGHLPHSDVLVVCGSYDLRVCDHACDLLHQGVASRLLISGSTGNWTRYLWSDSEAEIFAARARDNGVAEEQLILESRATNFAENIAMSRQLVEGVRRVTLVTKPNSIRRVQQTLPIQWPEVEAAVSAPAIRFPDQVSNQVGVLGLIEEMVGDVHRLLVYPELGYQAHLNIPGEVLEAWQALIDQGFDRHLVASHALRG